MKKKILIFIVAYNAERFIESVLKRIPEDIWQNDAFETEILVIDDRSSDQTFERAVDYARLNARPNITVLYNPVNQGYGGNQKIGYHYAIEKGFDAVVLLHGDGQYPPEHLHQMIEPILNDKADVILASRMLDKSSALRGRMPFYKWFGNQVLTMIQNRILKSNLSEFHTGYRAYRVASLAAVPFQFNADYFDFDTDILIQMLDTKQRIIEIPIPTFYGEEVSHVDGMRYGRLILTSSLQSRIMRWGIFYHPRFDYEHTNEVYTAKFGYPSSHEFAIQRVPPGSTTLDIGGGPGYICRELKKKGAHCILIDRSLVKDALPYVELAVEADVETYDFNLEAGKVDVILALDIIEHLKSPEAFMDKLRARFCQDHPLVIVTTGNIAFLPLRLALLFNRFNYGRKGILDFDHTRLFTFSSLRRLLVNSGYDILEEAGIPAPWPLAFGEGNFARTALKINLLLLKIWRSLFAYQAAIVARPRPTLGHLLKNAYATSSEKVKQIT